MILDTLEVHSNWMNLPVYNGTFFFSSFFTDKNLTPILKKNQLRSYDENTTWRRSTFWAKYRGEWEWSIVQKSDQYHVNLGSCYEHTKSWIYYNVNILAINIMWYLVFEMDALRLSEFINKTWFTLWTCRSLYYTDVTWCLVDIDSDHALLAEWLWVCSLKISNPAYYM